MKHDGSVFVELYVTNNKRLNHDSYLVFILYANLQYLLYRIGVLIGSFLRATLEGFKLRNVLGYC